MTKAMRMMEDSLKYVDGVMLILDARAPFSSINDKLDALFKNKKVLYVLNKSDLVEQADVKYALTELRKSGKTCVSISATDKKSVDFLYEKIYELLKDKVQKYKEKGILKPIRIMVAGVPNTGKSTIINALCGGKKTMTGNKAGVTRGKQWVRIKDLELLDTPGTMPPSFSNQLYARHLAYIGSMNDANIDISDLAYELIGELCKNYPDVMREKYGITDLDAEQLELFNQICEKRKFLLKGGDYDYERCATAVIDDFRKGRIGKIFLDK